MSTHDDNEKLIAGTLSLDPAEDAVPVTTQAPNRRDADGWDHPVPFGHQRDLPAFPIEILPSWANRWVAAIAEALQCPLDLPAMLVIAVLSLATAKKFVARVRRGWEEPINVYVVNSLSSGESKSPVFEAAVDPVEQFEILERLRLKSQIESAVLQYDILTKRIDALKMFAAKASDPTERAQHKREAEQALQERVAVRVPISPRWLTNDITSERLVEIMRDQGGLIGVFSDEGGPFELMGGRYSDGIPNFEVYLKAHSGGSVMQDRIGRSPASIRSAAIVLGLAVQPSVIASLGEKKGFRGKGLLARILYSLPKSCVGARAADPLAVTAVTREQYETNILALLAMPPEKDDIGEILSTAIPLTHEAYQRLVQLKRSIEPRLAPDGDLEPIADWVNKLAGETVRVAALLHLGDRAGGTLCELSESISGETMDRAIKFSAYAIEHALAAFDLIEADPALASARTVLAWIKRKEKKSFDRRGAHQGCRSKIKKVADIDPAIQILIEYGYIRPQAERPGARGRPASPAYDVNPRWLSQNSQKAQNGTRANAEPNSECFEYETEHSQDAKSRATESERQDIATPGKGLVDGGVPRSQIPSSIQCDWAVASDDVSSND